MNKGVVFDFNNEVGEYSNFLLSFTTDTDTPVSNRLATQLLNNHVEYILDKQLHLAYRGGLDVEAGVIAALETLLSRTLDRKELDQISDFVSDLSHSLYRIIVDSFHGVSMQFAMWHVNPIASGVILIEFQGDYRIMEWHATHGIENDECPQTVRYEFEAGHLLRFLIDRLAQYRGTYAGQIFNRTVRQLYRVVVEEFIFENKRDYVDNPLSGDLIIADYVETKHLLAENFPLASEEDYSGIIVDIENTVKQGLLSRIRLTANGSDIISWYITDEQIVVEIDRPIKQINFSTRLKEDIQTSIDNGDYVPKHLRDIVNKL